MLGDNRRIYKRACFSCCCNCRSRGGIRVSANPVLVSHPCAVATCAGHLPSFARGGPALFELFSPPSGVAPWPLSRHSAAIADHTRAAPSHLRAHPDTATTSPRGGGHRRRAPALPSIPPSTPEAPQHPWSGNHGRRDAIRGPSTRALAPLFSGGQRSIVPRHHAP